MIRHHSLFAGLGMAATLGLVGCSQGGQVSVSAGAITSTPGDTASAPPADSGKASLLVTIDEVKVHLAGSKEDKAEDGEHGKDQEQDKVKGEGDDEDGGWFTVFEGAQSIDLLDAQADQVFLGSITVPAGRITQVRLILEPAMQLVLDGKSLAVSCAACTRSGLKVVIPGGLEVQPGGSLDLSLDIDARASLLIDASGYRMTPVIRIVNKTHR